MAGAQRKATFVPAGGGAHLAWFGERLRYLAVSEQTASHFAMCAMTIPAGDELAPHVRHREHLGLYLLSGHLAARVGSRTLSLETGSFLEIGPGGARQFSNPGPDSVELLLIAAPAGFEELQFRTGVPLSSAEEPAAPLTAEDRSTLASLAPGYGMELHPGPVAFQAEPAIRLTLPGEGRRIALLGNIYRFLAVSEDTGGRYALMHVTAAPGGGPPLHSHTREDEAFFVLTGELNVESDGACERVGAGSFVHLPGGTRHRYFNDTPQLATMLTLVAPAGLERLFDSAGRDWHHPEPPEGPPDPAEILRLIENAPKFGLEIWR